MELSLATCHAALGARDARFDGRFFVGVSSTGIYCRPVCPARLPKIAHCDFFAHAAAAERAGFRPCLRCRPELAPGLASMDAPDRIAAQAAARIEAGALDAGSLDELASALGVSSRHLRRVVADAYGASPVELALTRRLHSAKALLTDTRLPVAVVAQAAGFGSQRRLNAAFLQRYGFAPGALRKGAQTEADHSTEDFFTLRLAYRPPLAWPQLLGFLSGRGAAGVEAAVGNRYCRTVRLGGRKGWIAAAPDLARAQMLVQVSNSLLPVLPALRQRLRQTLDLDAHPRAVAEHLASDARLAPSVERLPGLRVPGAFDGFELGLRAVLGQQVSVKAATTLFGRFANAFGERMATPFAALTHLAPTAEPIAQASVQQVIALGLTGRRAETVLALARACADGQLNLSPLSDPQSTVEALLALPGIGPWTAQYIAMRALRDPDAMPTGDLALLKAVGTRNHRELEACSAAWRPWRAYAALYFWNAAAAGG